MRKLSVLLLIGLLAGCTSAPEKIEYEASWESLAQHEAAPAWFQDAKLGIYFHWGVYAVPAYGSEWYPSWMHFPDHKIGKHHLETYGHPSEYGYHDFVPMFTAEHFDAEEWADLFVKAGARFAGPVAEHHDGFSLWDSDVSPWNVADMGPKRDLTGELEKAIKDRDMKFITTFHHARNLQRSDSLGKHVFSSHYPYFEGIPPSSDDEKLKYLYGNMPEEEWLEEVWLAKLKEVIDQYQPDIMWFDSWMDQIPDSVRQAFCAYYLNAAEDWNTEVVIVRKQDDLPLDFSVDDLEKSRKNKLEEDPWMTDETISKGSWCYTENLEIKASADVLHVLIDIVSKNGVLLLNISPTADGTIPEDQRAVLMELGEWLGKYGEAIYESRPWYTFGEGPTKEPEGHFKNHREFLKIKYSGRDVRYTTKDNLVYASVLGWPDGKKINLSAFAEGSIPEGLKVKSVSLLGCEEKIQWALKEGGLTIQLPEEAPDDMAVVFKITTK